MYFQEQGNFGNLKPRERSSIFLESLRSKSRRTNPSKFLSYLRRNFRLPFEITVPRLYHWHSFLPRYPTIDLIALRLFLKKKERRNPNKRLNVICQIENLDKLGHVATNKKPRPGSFQLAEVVLGSITSISRSIVYPTNDSSSSVGMYIGSFLPRVISLRGHREKKKAALVSRDKYNYIALYTYPVIYLILFHDKIAELLSRHNERAELSPIARYAHICALFCCLPCTPLHTRGRRSRS